MQSSPLIPIDPAQPIGIIGVGLMGTAVGSRLLANGYSLRVWNRNQPEAQTLLQAGALWSENPLSDCQRVIICLYSSQIVGEVIQQFQSAVRRNQIVIDMTTGAPQDAIAMALRLESQRAYYLEAPVSGSSEQTRSGQAMLMVGGERIAFEACRDLWAVLAKSVHFTGDHGSASSMKLVTNLVLGLNRAALAEGLAFAQRIGIEPAVALTMLADSAAASRVMDSKGQKMVLRDFSVQARLLQHLKDVMLILDLAAQRGMSLPLTSTHRGLLEHAERIGCGDLDNSAIIRVYDGDIGE
jgi:3-hydroxyisobutyrate dehydrogenase-like beta-hydroxyacid dehydrogenase